MAISSPGIGSNLDVNSIVSQLMALEQKPLTALQTKEAGVNSTISALGSLNSVLSALQSAAASMVPDIGQTATQKFSTITASIADPTIASATATSSAVPGVYSLEVTQLAQQHRIVSSATQSPFTTNPDGTVTLATGGTLTITLDTKAGSGTPTKTTNVTIADGSTPEAIRDAINAAGAGVSATVINGTAGKQLVLVGDSAGSNQFIKLSGVSALSYDPNAAPAGTDAFVQGQQAQGSAFILNGIPATANTNTVTTVIDGLTLNLTKQSASGVATTLTLSNDTSSLASKVSAFVTAYNSFATTAAGLGSYNATTKVAGALNGDSTLRLAQSQMRSLLGNIPAGITSTTLQRLSDIGVSLQKDGTLTLDSSKLATAMKSDLTGVANLVAAYGTAFNTATKGLVGTSGGIAARTSGLNDSITSINKQMDEVSNRLTIIEANYRKQFTDLDTLISGMTQTSTFLTQQLANLPKLTLSNS